MKKLTKEQKAALTKAFRLLRAAGAEGERRVVESDRDEEYMKALLTHADAAVKLASDIQTALQMHIGAQLMLESIEPKRSTAKKTPMLREPLAAKKKRIEAELDVVIAGIEKRTDIDDDAKAKAIDEAMTKAYGGKRIDPSVKFADEKVVSTISSRSDGVRTLVYIKGGRK